MEPELKSIESIFPTKKEKMEYYCRKNIYCNKIDGKKHNIIMTVMAFVYRIFHDFLFNFVIATVFFYLLIITIKYQFIEKKELFAFIDEEKKIILFNAAIALFGITMTIYSIIFAFKNVKYLHENQFELLLKSGKVYSLRQIIMYDIIYLGFMIYSFCTGEYILTTLTLILYLGVTIFRLVLITLKSNARIYYDLNFNFFSSNPFMRRKENYFEIASSKNVDFNESMLLKFALVALKNGYTRSAKKYFNNLVRCILYKNNDNLFDFDIFDLYVKCYFKNVCSDSQLVGTLLVFKEFDILLNELSKNEMKELYYSYLTTFIIRFNKLLNSRTVKKRFILPEERLVNLDIKSAQCFIVNVLERNVMLVEIFKNNYDILFENIKASMNDDFFDDDIEDIDLKMKKLYKVIDDYNKLTSDMSEKYREKLKEYSEEIKTKKELLEKMKNHIDKIEKNVTDMIENKF